jgi:hypothetical protein
VGVAGQQHFCFTTDVRNSASVASAWRTVLATRTGKHMSMGGTSFSGVWSCLICLFAASCSGDGNHVPSVGEACSDVLPDELQPRFSNYGVDELNVDCGASECRTSVGPFCMTYHFQGRVTCPYGQTESQLASFPATDPGRCRLPRADGTMTTEPVEVTVAPQLAERRPEKTIFYTCVCAGTDSTREYCTCPAAMHCETLSEGFLATERGITGLCVRDHAAYEPSSTPLLECSTSSLDALTDCGNNRQNP